MSPEERRDKLIDVTLSLLREHGRAVTTRQIAEAAGVAEGTIFRVVESKEELVEAAIDRAFQPGALAERIQEIDPTFRCATGWSRSPPSCSSGSGPRSSS